MTSDLFPYYWQSEKCAYERRVWYVMKRWPGHRNDLPVHGSERSSLDAVKRLVDKLNAEDAAATLTPKEQTK